MSRCQQTEKPCEGPHEDRPESSASLESLRHLLGPDAGKIDRGIVFTTTAKDEWLGHMSAKNPDHHERIRSEEYYDQNHKCIRRGQYAPRPYVPYLNEWMRNATDSDRLIMEKFIASLTTFNKTAASKPKQPLRFNHEGGYRRKYRELHTWLTREEQGCSPPPPADPTKEQKSEQRKETPPPRREDPSSTQNEISVRDPATNSFFQTIQKPAVSFEERSGDRHAAYNKKYEKSRPDTAPTDLGAQIHYVEHAMNPRSTEARAEHAQSSCPPNPLYPNRRSKSCLPNRPKEGEQKLQAHIMTDTGVKMQKKFVHKKLQGNHVPSDQDLVPVPKTYTRTHSAPLGQTRANAKKRSTMVYNHNTKPCGHKCHDCGVTVADLPRHMVRCQAERIVQNRHERSKSCPVYVPEVYDFEHKATNFEAVKRHVVGNRGHFTIHPQFVSENSIAPHMVSSKEWKAMY